MSDDAYTKVGTTIREFSKGFEEAVSRNYVVFERVLRTGQFKRNCSGPMFQWQVLFRRQTPQVGAGYGTTTINVDRGFQRFKTAFLRYENFVIAEGLTKFHELANRGEQALINYTNELLDRLKEDALAWVNEVLYIDGHKNPGHFSGLDTMFGGTQTINVQTGVPRTANAEDPFVFPDGTYASLSTRPGFYGGSWLGSWPFGKGSTQWDFWSPIISNYTSSYYGGSSWRENCVSAIRRSWLALMRNKTRPNIVIVDGDMFFDFCERQDSKERVIIKPTIEERSYGMSDREIVRQDGIEVTWEYGTPPGQGYVLSLDDIIIRSMQSQLLMVDGPHPSPATRGRDWFVDCYGQWQFKTPRSFAQLRAAAA